MSRTKRHAKTPSIIGPYALAFLQSPAIRYLKDFFTASRQYRVPLPALLGIAYHESGFFSNTPPGTSVMGGISGPGAGAGVAGAHDQIFYAARTLRGYITQNRNWNWVTALNYYNTGTTGNGYGADAMRIGNTFHFSGDAVPKTRPVYHAPPNKGIWGIQKVLQFLESHGAKNLTVSSPGAHDWVTIKGYYIEGIGLPFGIGVGQLGPGGSFILRYNLKTGKHYIEKAPMVGNGLTQFLSDPVKALADSFGGWWGGQKGSTLVKWVIGIVAVAILFGATKSLAGGGPKITVVAPNNPTPNPPKIPNVATT